MRRAFIVGNWKMSTTPATAVDLVTSLAKALPGDLPCDVGVAPPFVCLAAVHEAIHRTGKGIKLGAQNVHWEKNGAYTGEISAEMLKFVGCDFAIIGHSERRQYAGETNETVNKRLRGALASGLAAIVCVGEDLEQREAGVTKQVVMEQTTQALEGLAAGDMAKVTIAYEPVWAIGTGRTATPGQAQEVHALIRSLVQARFGAGVADGVRIQYGGSVKPGNIDGFMACPDVDGALVGGASLKAEDFARIVGFKR